MFSFAIKYILYLIVKVRSEKVKIWKILEIAEMLKNYGSLLQAVEVTVKSLYGGGGILSNETLYFGDKYFL